MRRLILAAAGAIALLSFPTPSSANCQLCSDPNEQGDGSDKLVYYDRSVWERLDASSELHIRIASSVCAPGDNGLSIAERFKILRQSASSEILKVNEIGENACPTLRFVYIEKKYLKPDPYAEVPEPPAPPQAPEPRNRFSR